MKVKSESEVDYGLVLLKTQDRLPTKFVKHICDGLYELRTEKAMAPHSSTLAWKIPWTEEPGRLQSMGSLRVRHD